jgi:hypothetical protein
VHTVSLLSVFKENHKKVQIILSKSLLRHAWPELKNVLYNGQAVVHTVSLLSVYKEKHKKDKLYIKSLPHMPGWNSTMARLLCTPSPSSLCIKKSIKRTIFIIKSFPAHDWPSSTAMFSTMARLLYTPSPSALCIKKSVKRTNYIIKSLLAHAWPEFN